MQCCQNTISLVPVASGRPGPGLRRVRPFAPVQRPCRGPTAQPTGRRGQWISKAEPEASPEPASSAAAAPTAAAAEESETVFYEGSGSNAELAISLLMGATLLFLPLTIASIGRRLWISYKFTNKRVIVTTNSPVLKREVQIEYKQIKEIRSAPRAFGAWGDVVIFLKDGSRLPIAGLERYQEIVDFMYGQMA